MPTSYRYAKYEVRCEKSGTYEVPAYKMTNRSDVQHMIQHILQDNPIENVVILALDNSNRVIGYHELQGMTAACVIYPQQVFRFLLSVGARCFILAHNHPGGSTVASESDWKITNTLQRVGKDLDIDMLDHIIIADENIVSLRENSRWK